jgi:hypothetical protein
LLQAGLPQALFPTTALTLWPNQAYAVTKDGQRFLIIVGSPKASSVAPLTVVLDWTAIHK